MRSLIHRIVGLIIRILTGWPAEAPPDPDSDAVQPRRSVAPELSRPPGQQPRSRLSPGAAEIQDSLARQQLRGDAVERQRPRQIPSRRRTSRLRDTPRTGPRAGYRWGRAPGDRTRESTSRTPTPSVRPDRARPALSRDQARRSDEREVRRYRQTRRAIEAKAAEVTKPPESRLSSEALEAQDDLVREQARRDAETRAQERPFRQPLRDRTRIGPLRGILKPRPDLPTRDPGLDMLVTAGFITAAVLIGGLTRLDLYDYSGLPWLLAVALAAALIALLILDNRRWSGSARVRVTRTGMVAGLVFFIGVTSIGRLGELAPVPLPDDCSSERIRTLYTDRVTERGFVEYGAEADQATARLRRPGRLESNVERAEAYVERGLVRVWLGEFERALADYQGAIDLDPGHVAAYVARARLLEAGSCLEHARPDLQAIQRLAAASEDGFALLDGARLLVTSAQELNEPDLFQAAVDVARNAAEHLAAPHEAELVEGVALMRQGRLQEALEVLTASIESFGLNANPLLFRGTVHRMRGDMSRALQDFELALKRRPRWDLALAAQGITLASLGRLDEGLAALNESLQLDDTYVFAWYWRGRVLLESGQPEAARSDFKQAIRLSPDLADPYVGLAAVEVAVGNRQEAVNALEMASERAVGWVDRPITLTWFIELQRQLGVSFSN